MKTENEYIIRKIKEETLKNLSIYGVKGWNMTKLASDSGIAKDTLYRIIGSKEKLIKEVLIERIKESKRNIIDIINEDVHYIDKFKPIINELSDFTAELSLQNMHEILLTFPVIESEVSKTKDEYNNQILEYIQEGIDNNYLKDNVEPQIVLNIIEANILYFLKHSDKSEVKIKISKCLNYMLGGIVNEKVCNI